MAHKPIEYSHWIVPGKLLAGEYPGDFREEAAKARVQSFLDAGIDVFIDLTEPDFLEPYHHLIGEARHRRFAIPDGGLPDNDELTVAILDAIDEHIAEGHTVYVHCLGGIGRTGTIVGCWLARHGEGGEDGLKRLKACWQDNPKSRYIDSPENTRQEQYVLAWPKGR